MAFESSVAAVAAAEVAMAAVAVAGVGVAARAAKPTSSIAPLVKTTPRKKDDLPSKPPDCLLIGILLKS